MTFNRLLLTATVAGLLAPTGLTVAATQCTDCPTPPPCSAEGGCYPKRETWGYYRTTWNRWPGDYDAATTAPGEKSALPGTLIPPATEEDRAAPPPSDAAEEADAPAATPGAGASEIDLPSLGPIPGGPGMPAQPAEPQSDGPPGLPPLPGFGPPPGIGAPPSTKVQPLRKAAPAAEQDTPPPLPAGFASLLKGRSGVVQATHRQESSPSDARPQTRVTPAYYPQTPRR